MTGMEHAIEQAARAEAEKRWPTRRTGVPRSLFGESYPVGDERRDSFTAGAKWSIEHLRAQGLLAPTPLREVQAEAWDEGFRDCLIYYQSHGLKGREDNPYRGPVDRAEEDS